MPDDIWKARYDDNRLREVLERRLGKDSDQPQVQKELEAIGFACSMSREPTSLHVLVKPSTPRFMCTARVSWITPDPQVRGHLYLWVEVWFAEQTETRSWRQIAVHLDGYGLF